VEGCLACDLAEGRLPLPGGRIFETTYWLVEHCVGPLGAGTLLVKPRRHVVRVSDLTDDESDELGRILRDTAAVVRELAAADQVYTCLWSHAGGVPVHVHYVVQPITPEVTDRYGLGPHAQAAMFDEDVAPPTDEVETFADRARAAFAAIR
jgi:diadenosine tetraphosphate (Ap4A) HIT family hydrolase